MKLLRRLPCRGSRAASRGSALGGSNAAPRCTGESGSLLLMPSLDSTASPSLDGRKASSPGISAARIELMASRPKAESVPSSGESGLRSSKVDARLLASCWAMKDIRYLRRARAGFTSSSVMQASGLRFASGCGSDVFRPVRWLVATQPSVEPCQLTATEGLREACVSPPE